MKQIVAAPTAAAGLNRLLAPIALHPDQRLARTLPCARNPPMAGRLDDRLTGATRL